MMRVPPICINFMLTCYFSPDPEAALGEAHWDSEAGRETRAWLLSNDLITNMHRATEKGEAWVKFICETPLPVQEWKLPERNAA